MPAGKELMGDAIAPGSTEYGTRGELESMLPSGGGGIGGAIPPTSRPPAPTGGPSGSPLERLLRGQVTPGEEPITSGLSYGPGAGPTAFTEEEPPMEQKLRMIAAHAKSPRLRSMARLALLRRKSATDEES